MDGICECKKLIEDCVFIEDGSLTKYYCQTPEDMQAKPLVDDTDRYGNGLLLGENDKTVVMVEVGSSDEEE